VREHLYDDDLYELKSSIYDCIVDAGTSRCDWDRNGVHELKTMKETLPESKKVKVFDEAGFTRIQIGERFNLYGMVKAYLSFGDALYKTVYLNIVKYLAENASETVLSKIATTSRLDTCIFWLNRNDFFVFEKYIKQYNEVLTTPMKLMAYRGKIGISRELLNSQNSATASVLGDYFATVNSADAIDIHAFYKVQDNIDHSRKYDDMWGISERDLCFLNLSRDVVLGVTTVTDKHLLLEPDWQYADGNGQLK
jgi:hypothetical protein